MSAPYFSDGAVTLHHGDSRQILEQLPAASVNCCVTSPPYYGLRDYDVPGQYGLEATPSDYVQTLRGVFAEVHRVLAADGALWLNLGDSYSANGGHSDGGATSALQGRRVRQAQGLPAKGTDRAPKNLLGMPWRVAFALQDDGWILRNAIVWHKTNAMPESATDRLSNRHELMFLFSKSPRYWFDLEAIKVPAAGRRAGNDPQSHAAYGRAAVGAGRRFGGNSTSTLLDAHETRNPGDVWSIATERFHEAHFATMPTELALRCITAGCRPGGVVLDPFSGSGTTGLAATRLGHRYLGIDINSTYLELSLRTRLAQTALHDEAVPR